ncbi:hypothetical protein Q1695_004781 [Nippostrongylus brasiliensis]|nr:hypothetical protein Q1695_004781 [Nippostrongylus brasiliensis]
MKLRLKKESAKTKGNDDGLVKKATPLFVHLLMVCGVGAYAVFGAVVMRKLETKTVAEVRLDVERRHAEQNIAAAARELELSMKHKRRRRRSQSEGVDEFLQPGVEISKSPERKGRATTEVMRSRRCIIGVIQHFTSYDCKAEDVDSRLVKELDKCYHVAIEHESHTKDILFRNSAEAIESVAEEHEHIEPWSFMDSLLFAFTVITTIGYGNVAPKTFAGRFFVIGYGLIGIPFTLLAIADLGKFLSELMCKGSKVVNKFRRRLQEEWRTRTKLRGRYIPGKSGDKAMLENTQSKDEIATLEDGKIVQVTDGECEQSDENPNDTQAFPLFVLFVVYIASGGLMLATYEPDMDFFKAVYFNFVTLTSIGLGDIVPRSETYMALTIVYIAVGLALTTIAIEIAADTLKKLHYYGRKIENVGNVAIWFGGKKITMKALVKNLGDQFNLPTTVVRNLDLDNFVDQAIKVEEGELETLRPPPFEPDPEDFGVTYVDDPNEEVWKSDPTPSPSPEPPLSSSSPPTQISDQEASDPGPEAQSELEQEEFEPPNEPSPAPSLSSTHVPSPEPKEVTPLPTPAPSPEPFREPMLVSNPTPPPTEPEYEQEPEPEPELSPEPIPEPEPERQHDHEPVTLQRVLPQPKPKPRPLTAAEIAAQKRRAYSEEAWRRYQEYQKVSS